MSDIKLIETGSGGDIVLVGNDIEMVSGVQNMPYIGLFGGNEQSTKEFNEGEERFDYWGNRLLLLQNKKAQFNSTLEQLLKNVALNSSSRLLIEDSIKQDLSFMSDFSVVDVETFIRSTDRIEIKVKISQSPGGDFSFFNFIWNVTEERLTPVASNAPTISNIVYLPLTVNETKNITITGTNYTPTTTVVIEKGLNTITVNSVTFDNSTQLTVNITTALITGGFDVTVDNGISVTLVDGITVAAAVAYEITVASVNKDNIDFGIDSFAGARTIEFNWTPTNTINAGTPTFALLSNAVPAALNDFFSIQGISGQLNFTLKVGASTHTIVTNSSNWTAGQTYHFGWRIDPVLGVTLHVNAILQISTNVNTSPIQSYLFTTFWGGLVAFNIRFDDSTVTHLMAWTSVRTPAEMIIDSTTFPTLPDANLIDAWDFPEGSGATTTGIKGTVGTLQTSNAGGLTYINANMWQVI